MCGKEEPIHTSINTVKILSTEGECHGYADLCLECLEELKNWLGIDDLTIQELGRCKTCEHYLPDDELTGWCDHPSSFVVDQIPPTFGCVYWEAKN
jgi:Ni2+-binding GTPase involved in maturation of urease and hydrogenase